MLVRSDQIRTEASGFSFLLARGCTVLHYSYQLYSIVLYYTATRFYFYSKNKRFQTCPPRQGGREFPKKGRGSVKSKEKTKKRSLDSTGDIIFVVKCVATEPVYGFYGLYRHTRCTLHIYTERVVPLVLKPLSKCLEPLGM